MRIENGEYPVFSTDYNVYVYKQTHRAYNIDLYKYENVCEWEFETMQMMRQAKFSLCI